ncbi:MAG: anthranilate synthase component I [Pseudomonadota bacterium]
MVLLPNFSTFKAAYDAGQNTLVYQRVIADTETPVSLMQKLSRSQANSFVLESVTGGEVRGRYSIIGMKPDLIWRCHGTRSETNRDALFSDTTFETDSSDPLTALRGILVESEIEFADDLPPMSAGLFGYLGYDMIRLVEHLPDINPDPLNVPDAVMIRPSVIVIIDGVKGDVTIVSPAWVKNGVDARTAYNMAAERVSAIVRDMDTPFSEPVVDLSETPSSAPLTSNTTKDAYFDIVERAKEYIRAGDIFQVVPSQRWTRDFSLPPFSLYRALRRTNPSPYMFYFDFGAFHVTGASPEILVHVGQGEVTIRPIAGTRPRGSSPELDLAYERDLLADEKELAEHLMLLDLGRNDVGRVAKTGTVKPTEQFIIERYSHVMHIVSNVVGVLRDDEDALSALLAGLPAGTVSGAPKVRAMEIIDELETEKRGVYGGGVGYFSSNGDMDICIALRTGVLKDGALYIQAGGGVVFDSDPEAEFQETVNKSLALVAAADTAAEFVKVRGGN